MEVLYYIGMFLAGLGVFLLGSGLMWWISINEKRNKAKQKEEQ